MAAVTNISSTASRLNLVYHNMTNLTDFNYDYFGEIDYCDGYRDVDFLMRNIWMYVGYPILILGTIGHFLVMVLLLFNKGLRSLPLAIFLLTMSAAGLMALYVGLLPTIIKHQTCYNERAEDKTTEAGCQVFKAAIYFFLQLYSWMEASVAVERMCAVLFSTAYNIVSTRRNNALIVGIIVIVLLAINGIHFKIFGTDSGTCRIEDEELFKAWQFVHSTLYILFPVSVMLPANAITLHTMYRSPMKASKEIKKAKPVAIMMIILNGIFVVTTLPILVGDFEHLAASEYEAVQLAWTVSRLMMYLGCSLTFLVYLVVAARFRKALSRLLATGKNKAHAALVAMSGVARRTSEKPASVDAGHGTDEASRDQADSSTDMTTEGSV